MESELEAKAWELFKEWSKDAAGMPTIKDSLRIAKDWIAYRDSLRPAPSPPEERRGDAADRFANCPKNTPCTPHGCEAGEGKWPRCPTEPADLPLPHQAEAIARGEMAERLRVAEKEVERLRAGIEQALADMEAGYMPFKTIRALLEAAP